MAKPTREELVEALRRSTIQLQDLVNGWPTRELFEPTDVTLRRNRELLQRAGVDDDCAAAAPEDTAAQRREESG